MSIKKLFETKLFNNISKAIKSVRLEFSERHFCSFEEINQGMCVDFVDEVEDRFSGKFETLTSSMFYFNDENKKNHMINNYDDEVLKFGEMEWSKNMLEEYGYPDKELLYLEPPKHIWILYSNKHYDAEHPEGVSNPWELSIFSDFNWEEKL